MRTFLLVILACGKLVVSMDRQSRESTDTRFQPPGGSGTNGEQTTNSVSIPDAPPEPQAGEQGTTLEPVHPPQRPRLALTHPRQQQMQRFFERHNIALSPGDLVSQLPRVRARIEGDQARGQEGEHDPGQELSPHATPRGAHEMSPSIEADTPSIASSQQASGGSVSSSEHSSDRTESPRLQGHCRPHNDGHFQDLVCMRVFENRPPHVPGHLAHHWPDAATRTEWPCNAYPDDECQRRNDYSAAFESYAYRQEQGTLPQPGSNCECSRYHNARYYRPFDRRRPDTPSILPPRQDSPPRQRRRRF